MKIIIWNSRIPLRKVLVSHVKITRYCPKRILFLEGKNFCKFEEIHRPIWICSHLLNSFLQKDLCLCRDFTEILLKKGTEKSTKFKHFLKLANVQVYLDPFKSFMLNTAKKMSITKFFVCIFLFAEKKISKREHFLRSGLYLSPVFWFTCFLFMFFFQKKHFLGNRKQKGYVTRNYT